MDIKLVLTVAVLYGVLARKKKNTTIRSATADATKRKNPILSIVLLDDQIEELLDGSLLSRLYRAAILISLLEESDGKTSSLFIQQPALIPKSN